MNIDTAVTHHGCTTSFSNRKNLAVVWAPEDLGPE